LFLTGSAETNTLSRWQALQIDGARSPSAMELIRLPDPAFAAAFLAGREVDPAVGRSPYRGRAMTLASIASDFRHSVLTRQTRPVKLVLRSARNHLEDPDLADHVPPEFRH